MTPNEVIKTLEVAKAEVEWNYPMDYTVAMDEAIKAVEKQIPKKPTHTGKRNIYGGVYRKCNVCGDEMLISPSAISYENYCRFCGNRLTDWEVEE